MAEGVLLERPEFHKSKAHSKIEEACIIVGDVVLIQNDHTSRSCKVGMWLVLIVLCLNEMLLRGLLKCVMLQIEIHQKLDNQLTNSIPCNIIRSIKIESC